MKIEINWLKEHCRFHNRGPNIKLGRPWIAKVTSWPRRNSKTQVIEYGGQKDGFQGILTIDAKPGDVIKAGQRVYSSPTYVAVMWWIVQDDGSLQGCTPSEAWEHYCLNEICKEELARDGFSLKMGRQPNAPQQMAVYAALLGGRR